MCEYCDLHPTTDFIMKVGAQIEEDGYTLSKIYVCQTEEGYHCLLYIDFEGDNHYIPIEYCPICGRPLVKEDYDLNKYSFDIGA